MKGIVFSPMAIIWLIVTFVGTVAGGIIFLIPTSAEFPLKAIFGLLVASGICFGLAGWFLHAFVHRLWKLRHKEAAESFSRVINSVVSYFQSVFGG